MHSPFSPAIPDDENRIFVPMVLTAIAVDKDKNSQHALKWAVDNIVAINHAVSLVHVRCRHPHNNSSGTIPKDGHAPKADTATDAGKDHLETETSQLLVPFKAFCARKGIQAKEVILEDNDVARALVNYITSNHIHNIILGAARTSLAKKFRNNDVPSSIVKSAPEFCGVYVISKGKPVNVRLARGPGAIRPKQPLLKTTPQCDPDDAIQTPFGRGDWTPIVPYPTPERKSYDWNTDKAKPASWQRHGSGGSIDYTHQPMRTSTSHESLLDDMDFHEDSGVRSSDFGDDFELSTLIENSGGPSTPTSNRDMEAEMKRLKLELKQTMDMYSTACKEAISAKQKAKELHLWKIEEERKLDEARQAEEAAFAMAEMEKAKCKAAIEAAEAAQKIAELEARKRMNAERKMRREAEEKQRALDVLHQNDVRYRKYTIEEIELATENFSNALKIGEGGYGPVYGAALDHTPVAIKVLRPDASQGRKQFQQEVEVLCCIRHPNMVLLLGACPEYGCLVYEYMDNGSLEDRLFRRNNTPPIPWPVRFKIAAEIATALLFLHQAKPEPLVHRDLKPANILLDRNYTSKISDVGLSRLVPPSVANQVTQYRLTSTAGTFCYIDPEYQSTGMLGIKSDIFSLGVLLLQIITAKPPMALAHHVGTAIEQGKFVEWLDPTVEDWPVEEAMRFAKLALKCAEMRRKDRSDLGTVVLPELNRLRNLGHAYESGNSVGCSRSSFSSESSNVPMTVAKSAVDQGNQEMVETTTPDTAPCASELQSTKLKNGSTEGTRTTEQVAEATTEHLAEAMMEQVVEATIEQLAQPMTENSNNNKISSSVSSNSSNATPPVHELDQVSTDTTGENNPNTEAPECTKPENASTEEATLTEQLGESLTNQSSNNSSFASASSNSSNSTPCLQQAMEQVNNDTMGMDNPIIEAPEFTKPENESREEAGTMDQLMAKHNSIDNSSLGSISSNSSNTSSRSESPAKTDQVNQEVEGTCKPKTGAPCISKFRRTESTHKSREGTGLTEQSFKSMTKQSSSSSSSSGSSHSFCSVSSNSSNPIPRSKSNLGSLIGGHNKDSSRRLKRRPTIPTCKPAFL